MNSCALQNKLTRCLTGSRLAKDRAAETVSKVMIPEAWTIQYERRPNKCGDGDWYAEVGGSRAGRGGGDVGPDPL